MIRPLHQDDIEQITLMEQITQVVPWTTQIFKDCFLAGYPSWVLEEDNQVVGFVILVFSGHECHLLNICIHPSYQRQGLGTQLLKFAMGSAQQQGVQMMYLEVRPSNLSAIHLYKKFAFREIAVRKDYYPTLQGREDALIFTCDLSSKSFLL